MRACVALVAAAVLGVAAPTLSLAQTPARTTAIRNGTVVVTLEDGVDHIVTKSARGEIVAESWCVMVDGSYDDFAGLFTRLVDAVGAHDVETVASLMQYP